jgi:hypothetical protein
MRSIEKVNRNCAKDEEVKPFETQREERRMRRNGNKKFT